MDKVRKKYNRAKSKGSPVGGRVVNSLIRQSIGKIGEAFGTARHTAGRRKRSDSPPIKKVKKVSPRRTSHGHGD